MVRPGGCERTWWEVYQFITSEEKFHPRALLPIVHYNAKMDLISRKYQNDPANQIPDDYVPESDDPVAVEEKEPQNEDANQSGLHQRKGAPTKIVETELA